MPNSLKDKEILKIAKNALSKYELCDHCLGRIFAKIESGLTNEKRGELVREYLKNYKKKDVKNGCLCSGFCEEFNHFAGLV